MDESILIGVCPLLVGWVADRCLGDPERWPHPVVAFGHWIAWGERRLNRGKYRVTKGALFALLSVLGVGMLTAGILYGLVRWNPWVAAAVSAVGVFYCLSGRTLAREVQTVFEALEQGTEAGRQRLSRIVGRDTSALNDQQIRTAALETLAENLSDGVIAPLFWFLCLGLPGMFAYKMVNTLDSMIGYKTERYGRFGRWAAHIDDVANYVPARLTASLLILCAGRPGLWRFVKKYGRCHASPNSGYPESAMAGLLDCRFGGPNFYFGQRVDKPYIGHHEKTLGQADLRIALRVCLCSEVLFLGICVLILALL